MNKQTITPRVPQLPIVKYVDGLAENPGARKVKVHLTTGEITRLSHDQIGKAVQAYCPRAGERIVGRLITLHYGLGLVGTERNYIVLDTQDMRADGICLATDA